MEFVFGVSFCSGLFIFCSFCSGLFIFCSTRKHMLVTLLGLEFFVLSVYLFMVLLICSMGASVYFIFVFLVFSACEACLGMSILIFMIRSYGNNYLASLNILVW